MPDIFVFHLPSGFDEVQLRANSDLLRSVNKHDILSPCWHPKAILQTINAKATFCPPHDPFLETLKAILATT